MRRPKLHKDYGRVKRMNDSVYTERRQVMDFVYEAKNMLRSVGFDLPRINVRISDKCGCDHQNVLGLADLGMRNIYIHDTTLNKPYLRQVVLHEIVHAVTGFVHDEKCPLMHPVVQIGTSQAIIDKAFISYFK